MRIRDGVVTGWHNDIKGASALAVAGSRVGPFGGYGPDYDRLALAELGADRARPAGEYRVVLPGGEPIPAGTQIIGRGSRLHFLTGTSWYQLAAAALDLTTSSAGTRPRSFTSMPCALAHSLLECITIG